MPNCILMELRELMELNWTTIKTYGTSLNQIEHSWNLSEHSWNLIAHSWNSWNLIEQPWKPMGPHWTKLSTHGTFLNSEWAPIEPYGNFPDLDAHQPYVNCFIQPHLNMTQLFCILKWINLHICVLNIEGPWVPKIWEFSWQIGRHWSPWHSSAITSPQW